MPKEQDKRTIHSEILEKETERLPKRQVSEMQESCPDTPQQFRDMVQKAVMLQLEDCGQGTESPMRYGKKRRYRAWLLAAAVLAAGTMAVAAGNGWLKEQLLGRGFTEEEAEALVVTEPEQQVSELTDAVYPSGAPIQKEWSEPLLTVEEAYFDGNSLYFIAKPSGEAGSYDLYLRDHASVNGQDGITSLSKLEDEDRYFGQIEIRKKENAAEIIDVDSVKVDMTVVAYPRYEGKILYTWKDADVYEQVFGTGAFESEYGWPCYVGPFKDMIAGYMPHELTMEIPLTEEGKQVIEQYLGDEDLYAGNPLVDPEGQGKNADEENPAETPEVQETAESRMEPAAAAEPAEIEGNHVTWEIPGEGGSLKIDAEIINEAEHVYTGTLHAGVYPDEILKSLYEEGDPEQWEVIDSGNEDGTSKQFQYQDRHIFAGGDLEMTRYENNEAGLEVQGTETTIDEEENRKLCMQVLEKLGLNGRMEEDEMFSGETAKYYKAQIMLEGLPLAWSSQWNTTSSMRIENGELASAFAPAKLTVAEKEEVTLPGIEKALERVGQYVRSGELDFTGWAVQPVTEIALEYYVDLTKQGLVFRPIWNFKLTFLTDAEDGASWKIDGHIYIDALTGALVRDTFGW